VNFKTSRGERVELNLTAFVDVLFVMLLFFVVTTTFKDHGELKIQLPAASAEPEQQQERPLELVIDQSGRYYIDGRALVNTQATTLMVALDQASQGHKDKPMVISADARTPHQSVVTAMDTAARLGLTRFSIATTQAEDAP
jgi:biopolymer transport protein ExbD